MLSKSQAANSAAQTANSIGYVENQTGSLRVSADSGYESFISALFSFLAIVISIWTAFYSRKSDRRSLFDSDFGSPLRTSLRELEQSADELSAFVFPSGKDLEYLKDELQNTQAKIEEKTVASGRIIREVDTSTTVAVSGWEKTFLTQAQAATLRLESMYSPMVTNLADFQSRAELARTDYRNLVADTRQKIDDIRRGL